MGVEALTKARSELLAFDVDRQPGEVTDAIARAVQEVAPHQMAAVLTTDPQTMLPAGGTIVGFEAADCVPFWDNEFLDPDFNKFADLARRHDPVATLADTVDGDLDRSPRFAKMLVHADASDELRAAFLAGTSCLAVATFVRCTGEVFTQEEIADVRGLLAPATALLRRARGRLIAETTNRAPVVFVLDGSTVRTMTLGGQEVLDDLRVGDADADDAGLVEIAAAKVAWSREPTRLTTRVHSRSGRMYRLHAAPVEGEAGVVAVTAEAARPDDLASIVLESYGLTDRETEVALWLGRGLPAKAIAAEMVMSIHTVRDYIKAIYDKSGARSRAELMARLFTDHIVDQLHTTVTSPR